MASPRFLLCLLLSAAALIAQTLPGLPGASSPAPAAQARDTLGRETPRGAVFGFLESCRERDYERAAQYLELTRTGARRPDGEALARALKRVLDRGLTSDLNTLSDKPEGDVTDALSPDQERIGTVRLDGERAQVVLTRVRPAQGPPVWLFAQASVLDLASLANDVATTWAERTLPTWMVQRTFVDTPVWQWVALLLVALLAAALSRAFTKLAVRLLRPLVARTSTLLDEELLAVIGGPLRLLLGVALFHAGVLTVLPSLLLRAYLNRILSALAIGALAWLAIRFIDAAAQRIAANMTQRQWMAASSVVPLGRRSAKVAAVLIAIVWTLANWGYDTTALLAGLGVGGLAVALAAQKTIENLFGGLAIISDRPVLVGDFCKFGEKSGTVEDIGLRSTRIRTNDRTVVTIPNGEFSSLQIENFNRRDKIWFHPVLGLRRDTTPEQVRFLLVEIRRVLYAHPKVDPTPARVRFIAIGPQSLDLEVFSYIVTTNFDEYLEIQEDLLLRFLEVIARAGTSLAVPAQLSLVARDRGIDPEKQRAATEQVAQLRERGELPLPNFTPEQIRELAGTIPYPPNGASGQS